MLSIFSIKSFYSTKLYVVSEILSFPQNTGFPLTHFVEMLSKSYMFFFGKDNFFTIFFVCSKIRNLMINMCVNSRITDNLIH